MMGRRIWTRRNRSNPDGCHNDLLSHNYHTAMQKSWLILWKLNFCIILITMNLSDWSLLLAARRPVMCSTRRVMRAKPSLSSSTGQTLDFKVFHKNFTQTLWYHVISYTGSFVYCCFAYDDSSTERFANCRFDYCRFV